MASYGLALPDAEATKALTERPGCPGVPVLQVMYQECSWLGLGAGPMPCTAARLNDCSGKASCHIWGRPLGVFDSPAWPDCHSEGLDPWIGMV